jgi:cholesterol transport system auxiliary component
MRKFLIIAAVFAAGCAATRAHTPASIYDFGLDRSPARATGASSRLAEISTKLLVTATSPAWLDNPAIRYRLAYHNPGQTHVYANSRWISPPAALLAQRIKRQIASAGGSAVVSSGDGVRTEYAVRLDLEEFTQVFETPAESRVIVALRASLIESGTRTLLAQHSFRMERPAPEANAAGAALALTNASDAMIADLIDWLAQALHGAREKAPHP